MNRLLLVIGATCAVVFVAIAAPPSANTAPVSVEKAEVPTTAAAPLAVHAEDAPAVKPCARTEFKTQMIKKACSEGGQKAAKKAWSKWVKAHKPQYKEKYGKGLTCKTCHTKVGGSFPLNESGLKTYKEFGGK